MGNRTVRFFINKLFGNEVKDIMTGYRAFSRMFVKSFPVLFKRVRDRNGDDYSCSGQELLAEEIPVVVETDRREVIRN